MPCGAVKTLRPPPRQATIVVIGSTQPKIVPKSKLRRHKAISARIVSFQAIKQEVYMALMQKERRSSEYHKSKGFLVREWV